MADRRMRDLERRGDDVGAAAELLRARERAGALARSRLLLAARLGHPAAELALGEPCARVTAHELVREAPRWGWEALTRALLHVATAPAHLRALARYQSRLYRRALAAALEVLEVGDDDARQAAHALGQVEVPFTFDRWRDSQEGLYALSAARLAAVRDREDVTRAWGQSLHAMLDPLALLGIDHDDPRSTQRYVPLGHDALEGLVERLSAARELREGLGRGLSAWALGEAPRLRADEVEAHLDAC